MSDIQQRRKALWQTYYEAFSSLAELGVGLPVIPDHATNNGHMFYLVCRGLAERTALIESLKQQQILPVFHYLSLHKSPFYAEKHDGRELKWADHYTDCLVRLPLYYELSGDDQQRVIDGVLNFYRNR
jgi:dTDP-4-amino-4,6-dideoxygalactose transaminase